MTAVTTTVTYACIPSEVGRGEMLVTSVLLNKENHHAPDETDADGTNAVSQEVDPIAAAFRRAVFLNKLQQSTHQA